MERKFLKDYQPGETFEGFFVLHRMEIRTKRDGGEYLRLSIGDRSGRLSANLWDKINQWQKELSENSVVKLRGVIDVFNDTPQIRILKIRAVNEDDRFDPADFIGVTGINRESGMRLINRTIDRMKNPFLKALLNSFFSDTEFYAGFYDAPAGKLWHHNRIGGLVEHTLSMLSICRFLSRHYPEVDRDLLSAGVILHDCGKIAEYRRDLSIEYTDRGRLVGHIALGAHWTAQRAQAIDGFPPELLDQLLHLILSHQAEFGSPVQPATVEAFLLHYADQIDSKMDALKRIRSVRTPGERWKWVNLLERYIDLGMEDESQPPANDGQG